MLAFVVRKHGLAAVRKPLPALRAGWARVRVRLAGICNTDVEILRGYHAFRGTPGHEFVGEVEDVRGVSQSEAARWVGRRVCGEINIGCAALGFRALCEFCRRGMKTHCPRRKVLGIVAQDGAFAESLALPLENLHFMPAGVPDECGVFTEPLAAACEILEQVEVENFKSAAVIGDGKLAQLIARVLRAAELRVTMFGKHGNKLELARRAGIETRNIDKDSPAHRKRDGQFRFVVEATGSPTGLARAIAMTEPRGTLVLKSTFHGAAPVETWPLVVKEINLVGSRCGPFDEAIALLRSGKVDPRPLVSRVFPLGEARAAMAFAQRAGVLKVLLKP